MTGYNFILNAIKEKFVGSRLTLAHVPIHGLGTHKEATSYSLNQLMFFDRHFQLHFLVDVVITNISIHSFSNDDDNFSISFYFSYLNEERFETFSSYFLNSDLEKMGFIFNL